MFFTFGQLAFMFGLFMLVMAYAACKVAGEILKDIWVSGKQAWKEMREDQGY